MDRNFDLRDKAHLPLSSSQQFLFLGYLRFSEHHLIRISNE